MSDDLDGWSGADFVLAADRLDTPDVIEAADPADMLRQVASAAAQVRTALRSCAESDLSAFTPDARPRAVVVAGMGGSALAGEMLDAMTGLGSPVQVVVAQAGRLPGWVGATDAVLAVSCSGSTPETLAVAAEAARRGCRLAGVGAEGSPLHRIAEQARAPFVPVVPVVPASGLRGGSDPPPQAARPAPPPQAGRPAPPPQAARPAGSSLPKGGPGGWVPAGENESAPLPRAMLWSVTIPLLVMAERLGLTRIAPDLYEQAARRLEEVSHQCRPASESFVNPGKSLALDLVGALPVVWGTSLLSGVAAHRFASQLQENAKYPAISGVLPEAAYDQVAAFDGPFAPRSSRLSATAPPEPGAPLGGPDDVAGLPDLSDWDLDYEDEPASGFTPLRLILIADPDEEQRAAAQRAAVTELAGQRGVGISELAMDGEHPLVRLAGVIQLTDYASVYLAIASGIDPGQTVAIRDLRTRIE